MVENSWKGTYEIIGTPTGGGNADVYFVKDSRTGKELALKELRYKTRTRGNKPNNRVFKVYKNNETKQRFLNEIKIAAQFSAKTDGIIPIITSCENEYWYTMPIAKPIMEHVQGLEIQEIVRGVIQLCKTLEILHSSGVSHRDIKPANIYYYNNRFCFGDFGLVDFPDNLDNLTRSDHGLGAVFTIAPEMKRNPKSADGKKADVFSMAKTLWMLLTQDEKAFDGVYNYLDHSHGLRFVSKYREIHLSEIDELLKSATENDPNMRPNIADFRQKLEIWIDISSDMHKSQDSDWRFLTKLLFGVNPPDSCVWKGAEKIVNVLNIIGLTPAYNHMLFSDTGGLDFSHAIIAPESGCIKIYDSIGFCHIVKPKCLYYEGFETHSRWNYFLLELDEQSPIFRTMPQGDYEYLVEDCPAHYVSAQYANYGVYDYESGVPFPDGYEVVYRYTKGKFLIVLKTGPYNSVHGTYDGRHGDCSASIFREYTEALLAIYNQCYELAKRNDDLMQLSDQEIERRISNLPAFRKNPFKPAVIDDDDIEQTQERNNQYENSKTFLREKCLDWTFQDLLPDTSPDNASAVKFFFKFKVPSHSLVDFFDKALYVSKEGKLETADACDHRYAVYNRAQAVTIRNQLEERIAQLLSDGGYSALEVYDSCFSLELMKHGTPTHLFSKEEIKDAIVSADDRVNNQLVIDEYGYAKMIQNDRPAYLFPVIHEAWNAGNGYVGKYANLSMLDSVYISSLQGWLAYLQTGREQYMDYVRENEDIEDLQSKIIAYYDPQ